MPCHKRPAPPNQREHKWNHHVRSFVRLVERGQQKDKINRRRSKGWRHMEIKGTEGQKHSGRLHVFMYFAHVPVQCLECRRAAGFSEYVSRYSCPRHVLCVWELFFFRCFVAAKEPLSNSVLFSFCSYVLSSPPVPTRACIHINSGNLKNVAVQNSIHIEQD